MAFGACFYVKCPTVTCACYIVGSSLSALSHLLQTALRSSVLAISSVKAIQYNLPSLCSLKKYPSRLRLAAHTGEKTNLSGLFGPDWWRWWYLGREGSQPVQVMGLHQCSSICTALLPATPCSPATRQTFEQPQCERERLRCFSWPGCRAGR